VGRLRFVFLFPALILTTLAPLLAQNPSTLTPAPSNEAPPEKTPASQPAEIVQAAATPDSGANFLEAMKHFEHRRFADAAVKFKSVAEANAGNVAASYAWLARCYLHLHKLNESEAAAGKALSYTPTLFTAQSAMGEVLLREARMGQAEETFRQALRGGTVRDPRAMLGLSKIYSATANYKSAKILIDTAHTISPDDPDIFDVWLHNLKRREKLQALQKNSEHNNEPVNIEEQTERFTLLLAVLQDVEKNPERTCKLKKSPSSKSTIKLVSLLVDPKHIRGYGLSVGVNGAFSKLLIDTGASGILLNSRVVEKAGVQKIFEDSIGGIGDKGGAKGYLGFDRSIQIGDFEFENCYIDVVEKKSSLNEEGLIGMDVFSDFLVDLNFPDGQLTLSPLPPYPDEVSAPPSLQSEETSNRVLHDRYIPPESANYERFYGIGHNILLPTQVNQIPNRLFILDTGSWDNILSVSLAREASKAHGGTDIQVKGLSGAVKNVYTTGEVSLIFGKFRQVRNDLVAFDMTNISNSTTVEVSGMLGFAMLWMLEIKIDYRDNLIFFQYDDQKRRSTQPSVF
jgi:tetratricopeptide (TPR) repeat protein